MGGRVSASLEWLTHELHLSYSHLTAPQMKITYMQKKKQRPFSCSLNFSCEVSTQSFLHRFFPDGHHSEGVKLLNWSLVCTVSAVTPLAEWCSHQMIEEAQRRAAECQSSLVLSLHVAPWPLPNLSALSFFILSPPLVFYSMTASVCLHSQRARQAQRWRANELHSVLTPFKPGLTHWHLYNPDCN